MTVGALTVSNVFPLRWGKNTTCSPQMAPLTCTDPVLDHMLPPTCVSNRPQLQAYYITDHETPGTTSFCSPIRSLTAPLCCFVSQVSVAVSTSRLSSASGTTTALTAKSVACLWSDEVSWHARMTSSARTAAKTSESPECLVPLSWKEKVKYHQWLARNLLHYCCLLLLLLQIHLHFLMMLCFL